MPVESNQNRGKQIRRRQRDPVPPPFHTPPRGPKCVNWLPIGKRELIKRAKSLNEQRLKVIEIITNRIVLIIFTLFNISFESSSDILFKLSTVPIIDGLIQEFSDKLLSKWEGPKFRGTAWETKKWEGKNGYYKLCKNWFDQNKCNIAHTFWLPVLNQILTFINKISYETFTNNESLQNAFKLCLTNACLYSVCSSKVGFPKTRDLPLFLDTAIAKNTEIRKYLKEIDPNLHIYKFKEEESEKYNKDKKICKAVKERCIQYLGNSLQFKLNAFHKLINLYGDIGNIDLNKFAFNIRYDTKGHIGRSQNTNSQSHSDSHSNPRSEYKTDVMDEDDTKTEQSIPISLSLSSSLSASSSSPISPPISPPISTPVPSFDMHTRINRLTEENNNLKSELIDLISQYNRQRGQTRNVRHVRHSPYNPLPNYHNNNNHSYNNYNNQFELDGFGVIHSDQYDSITLPSIIPSIPSIPPIPPINYHNNHNYSNQINYVHDEYLMPEISTNSSTSFVSNVSNNSLISDTSSLSNNPICDRAIGNNALMNPSYPTVYNHSNACNPYRIQPTDYNNNNFCYPQYHPY